MASFWGPMWLLLLGFLLRPALGAPRLFAPVAWWTGVGPAVAYQEATGKIIYSPCNLNGTVLLPRDSPYILDTPETPKTGTRLAVAGWLDEGSRPLASFFYQASDDDIHNDVYACNLADGRYQRIASKRVKSEIAKLSGDPADINPQTGLAVASTGLGEQGDLRLLYHARNMSVMALHYNSTGTPNSAMALRRLGGSPTGFALSAGYLPSLGQFYVAAPADGNAIQITRFSSFDNANNWTRFPATRPSTGVKKPCERDLENLSTWAASTGTLRVTMDSEGNIDVFYIGSDSTLHSFVVDLDNRAQPQDVSDKAVWPTADQHDSPFAVASSPSGETWVYYQAGDVLAELHLADQQWQAARPVPTTDLPSQQSPPPTKLPSSTGASPPATGSLLAPTPQASSDTAAATPVPEDLKAEEAKESKIAGIIVGTVFGSITLAIILTAFVLKRQSRRAANAQARAQRDFDDWRPCQRPSLQHIRPWSFDDPPSPPAKDGGPGQPISPQRETVPEAGDLREAGEPAEALPSVARRPVSGVSNPERIGLAL